MATKKDKDTNRSEKMVAMVETISKAFEPSQILEKTIPGGKKAKYVKSQWYIARLNEAFGLAWSLEIFNHWLVNNHVVIHVRIHYPNPDFPDNVACREFKDGIASHPLSADVGNTFKSAYSKAFTIAASKVGSGLQLWGVETNADDADESPTWDNPNAGGAPVTVVNPGAHNMPPVPGTVVHPPVAPPAGMPPVPQPVAAPPPVAPGFNQPPPPPPQFVNSGATAGPPMPGVGAALPPPPVPVGNPSAGDIANATAGVTRGPDTSAVAAVGIASTGRPAGGIEDFQINGILGAAVTRAMDPLQLVASILGDIGITSIEQLTAEQAQRVMDAARQMPPQ